MPRHFADFVRMIPFQEYTNPHDGVYNLAVALRESFTVAPDLGPKSYIAYGRRAENAPHDR
eukprot:1195946-Prorocentrum_minimum.AAC.1